MQSIPEGGDDDGNRDGLTLVMNEDDDGMDENLDDDRNDDPCHNESNDIIFL